MMDLSRPQIHISVRTLVEFVIRQGDIDDRTGGGNPIAAMKRGTELHRKLQRRMGASYHAEVPLKYIISYEDYDLALEGRADGIIFDDAPRIEEQIKLLPGSGMPISEEVSWDTVPFAETPANEVFVTIDEIKGVFRDVEEMTAPEEVHLAQAKCYAYIVACEKKLRAIDVQMTYINLDTEEVRRFVLPQNYDELEKWFLDLIARYKRWADFSYYWRITRENSILALPFPFSYRPGQEKLCRDVFLTIKRKKRLFMQAPTGTGKTLSTIFPALKTMGDGLCDRIFYLTAKTITCSVAKDTFELLGANGLQAKTVILTAKDKICPLEERLCNPDDCPYAKGHFDRINDAVYDLLTEENIFDRDRILAHSNERMVCPFELSLDLSSWCDAIVGDYNYVFDPNVYLKRFFAEGGTAGCVFLVDEAHNLVERAREMYSASLVKEDFLSVKKLFTSYNGGIPSLLTKCNKLLLEWKKEADGFMQIKDIDAFVYALSRLAVAMEKFFEKHIELPHMDEIRDLYFKVRDFLNISEALDENYRIYCDFTDNGSFFIRLLCVDPSMQLQQRIDFARACVFFSATLLPVNYYKRLLCRDEEPYAVYAKSVFDENKRFVAIGRDVSSRYKRRNSEEYDRFAEYVRAICGTKRGNYMIFGPSYRFLSEVYERVEAFGLKDTRLLLQQPQMSEEQREEYLFAFTSENEGTLLGFCVMGGVFSEGIDLAGDKLIGAVILGVGLPMVTHERGLISDFFEQRDGEGFAYAYLYPGMNKVLQAAGRVIRTTEDVGVIALLDERFCYPDYRQAFPREWTSPQIVSVSSIEEKIIAFWSANCG